MFVGLLVRHVAEQGLEVDSEIEEMCQLVSAALDDGELLVVRCVDPCEVPALSDPEELRIEVRKGLRRFFNKTIERRPVILPIILEL